MCDPVGQRLVQRLETTPAVAGFAAQLKFKKSRQILDDRVDEGIALALVVDVVLVTHRRNQCLPDDRIKQGCSVEMGIRPHPCHQRGQFMRGLAQIRPSGKQFRGIGRHMVCAQALFQ